MNTAFSGDHLHNNGDESGVAGPDQKLSPQRVASEALKTSEASGLDTLRQELEALRCSNQLLRAEVAELQGRLGSLTPEQPTSGRRGLLSAFAGAAGGMLLAQIAPAAAADGDSVKAGMRTRASRTTAVETTAEIGLEGTSTGVAGTGVFGQATASSGETFGVFGRVSSTAGKALYGLAASPTGTTYGVYGGALSPEGFGMFSSGRFKATGRSFLKSPNSPPANADLDDESISFFLDQRANLLRVRVKYADGSIRNGSIALR